MKAIKTSKENCSKCPNYNYINGLCVEKPPIEPFMADFDNRKYYEF